MAARSPSSPTQSKGSALQTSGQTLSQTLGQTLGQTPGARFRQGLPREKAGPLALTLPLKGGPRLVALSREAQEQGLRLGQLVSDARPGVPDLRLRDADPAGDRAALEALAHWCTRFTPWVSCWEGPAGGNGGDQEGTGHDTPQGTSLGTALGPDHTGLHLDVTGCAHLFGGEWALCRELRERLEAFGFSAQVALADTPGAAWALARYGREPVCVVAPGQQEVPLAPLPVAALRLPARTTDLLWGLGLKTVGAVADLPRAPLAARFGAVLLRRLDQAWGREEEPVSPLAPVVPARARLVLAEPITDQAHVLHGLERLAADLGGSLTTDGRGARRLSLTLYRVDGAVSRLEAGTARAVADARHIARLFTEKVGQLEGGLDAGFGFEVLVLAADETEALHPDQYDFVGDLAGEEDPDEDGTFAPDRFDPTLTELMDRLGNRMGLHMVRTLHPAESHIPEQSVVAVPVSAASSPATGRKERWTGIGQGEVEGGDLERPIALLPCAEPIEVVAAIPEGPPRLFRWRRVSHQVVRAEGPERIAPEWWRDGESDQTRDYYRVEDSGGRRFWIYRHGLYGRETAEAGWYMHGLFP